MKWILPERADSLLEQKLCADLSLAPFLGSLLCRRGISSAADAQNFLYPRLKSLSDPFLLPNMNAAIDRILAALDRNERIVLYGDYDVDGVTSLAVFTRVLRAFGADPHCFLPSRMDEGYGLSTDGVARCVETLKPRLLIALDCGTSSVNEIAHLQSRGVDVIVFDHHECKTEQPDCVALVNPKLVSSIPNSELSIPHFDHLCSVGIVFKTCHAMLKRRPLPDFDLRDYLDLVALGTVADIVPLRDENRVFVQRGMLQMEKTRWVGLRVLMEVAGVRAPIRPSDIGFRLGPRLNAAGRLGTAANALELLLTEDASRARTLAVDLDAQNRDRQTVEQRILKQAEEKMREIFVLERDAAIVLGERGWHPGVLGIVASRISKSCHRPALVIGFDENGIGKGSGRSIEGLSLVQALTRCGALLEKFGGHEMAAGLTIQENRFAEFQRAFLDCARSLLTDDQLQPRLRLDGELALRDLDFDFLDVHELLQPFGAGNHQPLFFARGVTPAIEPRVLKEKHLLFTLQQNGRKHPAIYFNGAGTELPRPPWDVAFLVERNEFAERVSVQMQIKALRSCEE